MHYELNHNMKGIESFDNGKSQLELDESKVIKLNKETWWMFCIYDRAQYDIRIFYVNNNRTRGTLMPIIINNVYTVPNIIYNNKDDNNNDPATRIFLDCYSAYKEFDFNRKGFILHKVNYLISFGYDSLNTNSMKVSGER